MVDLPTPGLPVIHQQFLESEWVRAHSSISSNIPLRVSSWHSRSFCPFESCLACGTTRSPSVSVMNCNLLAIWLCKQISDLNKSNLEKAYIFSKVFDAVYDSVQSTESTDHSNLLTGKVSDHLYYFVQEKRSHHKFAFDVHELFLEFFYLLLRSQSFSWVHLFGVDVRPTTVWLAKYEAHQSFMSPFTNVVDQVPNRLQIFPRFLRQPTSILTKYFGQVIDIINDLNRKATYVLLRLRNFLGDMMSMGRWQEFWWRHHLRFLAERDWSLLWLTTWRETGCRE